MLFNLFLKKHAQHFMLLSKKTGMHFKNKQMAHASQTELTHSFKPFGWSKTAKEELKAHVGLLIEACIHVTCQAWWGRPMWLLFASLPQSRLQRAVCFGKLSAEWVINQSKNAWVRRGHSIGGRRIPDVGAEWKTRTEGKCRMWGPYKNCVHGEKEEKNPNKKPTSAPVLLFEYKIKGQAKVNKCTSTKEANTVVALHLRRFYSLCTCWNLFRIFRKN